jgi:hypothetical protein
MNDRNVAAWPWAVESVHRQGPYEFEQTGGPTPDGVVVGAAVDVGRSEPLGTTERVEPLPAWLRSPGAE